MMPPRRPARRTNNHLVRTRSSKVTRLTMRWEPQITTLEEIRKQVQAKAWEKLTR